MNEYPAEGHSLFNEANNSDPSSTPFQNNELQQLVWYLGRIGIDGVAQEPWLEYRETCYDTLQSLAREELTNFVS